MTFRPHAEPVVIIGSLSVRHGTIEQLIQRAQPSCGVSIVGSHSERCTLCMLVGRLHKLVLAGPAIPVLCGVPRGEEARRATALAASARSYRPSQGNSRAHPVGQAVGPFRTRPNRPTSSPSKNMVRAAAVVGFRRCSLSPSTQWYRKCDVFHPRAVGADHRLVGYASSCSEKPTSAANPASWFSPRL
jgi:hypothetical protein